MAKILSIRSDVIEIGMDDGSIEEVPSDSVNFVPHVGDRVEVFRSSSKIIVSKLESKVKESGTEEKQPTVVINNTNTNVNTNTNLNGAGRFGNPKNKWVALLLCLFLGVLGAHKFYENKAGMGLLYLCTGGLFIFGVVIDFFNILSKPNPYYV